MAPSEPKPVRLDERVALRPREAAAALGLSERTFRSLLRALPHVRVGGAVLIPVEPLKRWLAEHAQAERAAADRIADEILSEIRTDSR